jgi:tRNA nucleotidyltransferase (CCA-adding enzyme)
MSVASVLAAARKEVLPTKEEEKLSLAEVQPILKSIRKCVPTAKVILGGSAAKGTWLRTFDVDVFVMFPYKQYAGKSGELSDILEKSIEKKFPTLQRLHGSRDYFRISEAGFSFEVIPILEISRASQAKNITDISPLHSKWVKKHPTLANEIRLTKQFCKANNLYGAESYIRGFSGYICEILTIYYGSFVKLLQASTKWKEAALIDIAQYYKKKNVFLEINKSKLVSPLIVIDPVQHDRNAAAALSKEKFHQFIETASSFLKKPSIEHFREKAFAKADLKAAFKEKKVVLIHLTPLEGKDDIVGAKMMKVYEHLKRSVEEHEFKLLHADWKWLKGGDAHLYFVFDPKPLPKSREREGPPLFEKKHVINFKRMHKKTLTRNKRLYAIEKRKFTKPEELLILSLKDAYVVERVSSCFLEVC